MHVLLQFSRILKENQRMTVWKETIRVADIKLWHLVYLFYLAGLFPPFLGLLDIILGDR